MNFGPIMQNQNMEKRQQRFRSKKKHNLFTEEVNKIALSANYDKEYNQ